MDMRTIATALEYVHKGQIQAASSQNALAEGKQTWTTHFTLGNCSNVDLGLLLQGWKNGLTYDGQLIS